MATSSLQELPLNAGALDLKALEEKVLRTIEVLNKTRKAKVQAEKEIDDLKLEVMDRDEQIEKLRNDLEFLRKDREEARERLGRVIAQIDGLIDAEAEV
jgi:cell division protein FtsB